jgi:hypothetical protein
MNQTVRDQAAPRLEDLLRPVPVAPPPAPAPKPIDAVIAEVEKNEKAVDVVFLSWSALSLAAAVAAGFHWDVVLLPIVGFVVSVFVCVGILGLLVGNSQFLKDEADLAEWTERVLKGEAVTVSAQAASGPIVRVERLKGSLTRTDFLSTAPTDTPDAAVVYSVETLAPVDTAIAPVKLSPGDVLTMAAPRLVDVTLASQPDAAPIRCLLDKDDAADHARWMARMLRERELRAREAAVASDVAAG